MKLRDILSDETTVLAIHERFERVAITTLDDGTAYLRAIAMGPASAWVVLIANTRESRDKYRNYTLVPLDRLSTPE